MFDEDAILRIRLFCESDWGGGRMTKIGAEKNHRLRNRSAFLWCLPTFSRTGWRSRSALFHAIKPLCLRSTLGLLSCSTRPFGQVAVPIWPCNLQYGHAFSEKKYAEADNDASNPDDVETLLSYILNCTPCHSDEYSSCFFSCTPCFGINLVVCSSNFIVISINSIVILSNFIVVSKKWRILRWNSIVIYKKPFSAPLRGVSCGAYPIHVLTSRYTTWTAEKKLFNDVPNFKIRKLNSQVIQRFAHIYILSIYLSIYLYYVKVKQGLLLCSLPGLSLPVSDYLSNGQQSKRFTPMVRNSHLLGPIVIAWGKFL